LNGGDEKEASPYIVEWIRNGEVFASDRMDTSLRVTHAARLHTQSVTARPGDWFSIIVRQDRDPIIISNAIYVR
jgi:hypothetical protein